ncbi:DNA-binding XRE family transcriptional regulator [Azospirillum sp. OGB3]|nr:DNA-binding XRE family transcriptional regulator [Azospirillum sp. OGB3]
MSVRTGVTKKTYIALEKGKETVNVGLLVKVMSVLGYVDRLPDMLASDPLGEELEEIHGRKRGGYVEG